MNATDRVLPFEGVLNFRDMGGYAAAGGRKVKRGILYRSAELCGMTARDRDYLRTLNIRTVFDYRDDREAAHKPDPELPGVRFVRIPAMRGQALPADMREWAQSDWFRRLSAASFREMYVRMAFGNPAFRRLMDIVQEPDSHGVLHHCAGGRDRTGLGAAFILLALDVPRETIVADYLLSNEALVPMHERIREALTGLLDGEELARVQPLFELRREFLEAVFKAIDERYGDTAAFLEAEFGLDSVRRARLQERCLE